MKLKMTTLVLNYSR